MWCTGKSIKRISDRTYEDDDSNDDDKKSSELDNSYSNRVSKSFLSEFFFFD